MGFIKEVLFTVQCDNCHEDYHDDNSGYGFWLDKDDAWEAANDDGWTEENKSHYCPQCHHYNDDDQLIINTERTNLYESK